MIINYALVALLCLQALCFKQEVLRLTDTSTNNLRIDQYNVLKHYQSPIDISIVPPAINSNDGVACTVPLMNYGFSNSYGKPYIGNYSVPTCLTGSKQINKAVLKFQGNVKGRQYDRFGAVYLDEFEILRTTTAEPTNEGIQWNFEKDLSDKIELFYNNRTVTASVGNLVNEIYTGTIYIKIDLVFYVSDKKGSNTINQLIPISKGKAQEAWFTINSNQSLIYPINKISEEIKSAELELFISPHGCDEFWYLNSPDDYAQSHQGCINGAYREVKVYINDLLISSFTPFPTVYTGGITLTLWRPISGLGSFDVPTIKLDLLAYLPLLKQDSKLKFEVVNATEFWLLSGNINVVKSKSNGDSQFILKPKVQHTEKLELINNKDKFGVIMNKKISYDSIFYNTNSFNKIEINMINYQQSLNYYQYLNVSDNDSVNDYKIKSQNQVSITHFKWNNILVNNIKINDVNAITQLKQLATLPSIKTYNIINNFDLYGKLIQKEGSGPGGYNLSSNFNLYGHTKDKFNKQINLSLIADAYAIRSNQTASAIGDCKSKAMIHVKDNVNCYNRVLEANHGDYTLDVVSLKC